MMVVMVMMMVVVVMVVVMMVRPGIGNCGQRERSDQDGRERGFQRGSHRCDF
jgi:uncharacterized membrane protein